MKLEFLNHSSLLADCGEVRVVMDPWLEGSAFNDGWDLVAPSRFAPEDWARVTHIWFSHEHPDHFSPKTLRTIPEASRRAITVLYQVSKDRKIVDFCRKLGFREVRECLPGEWLTLAPGVSLRCDPFTSGDSWLAIKTPGLTLLNLNDCGMTTSSQVSAVQTEVGPVDVLATQFSISAWDGNPEEIERLRAGATKMIERMVTQVTVLKPRWTIPFASFVRFSHEENQFLNAFHNSIELAEGALNERTSTVPVVLYPGDTWEAGSPHDNQSAVVRWQQAYQAAAQRPLHANRPVTVERLQEAARAWCSRLGAISDPLRLRLSLARVRYERMSGGAFARALGLLALRAPRALIWLEDQRSAFAFAFPAGLTAIDAPRSACDVALSSDSLLFALENLFGGETLLVNARFREVRPGSRGALFSYFELASGVNQGLRLSWSSAGRRLLRLFRPA